MNAAPFWEVNVFGAGEKVGKSVFNRYQQLKLKAADPSPNGGLDNTELNEYVELMEKLGMVTNPDFGKPGSTWTPTEYKK